NAPACAGEADAMRTSTVVGPAQAEASEAAAGAVHGQPTRPVSFDDDLPRHVGVCFAEVFVCPGRLELERKLVVRMQGPGVEERRRGLAGYCMGDVVGINPGDGGARRYDEFLRVKNGVIDGHFRRRAS